MTTHTTPAAATGLPDRPFAAGLYRIAGNEKNRLPAGAHAAHIVPVPQQLSSKPGGELFVTVDEAPSFSLPLYIKGSRELIESWIVERIETDAVV